MKLKEARNAAIKYCEENKCNYTYISYSDLEEFINMLQEEISARYFVPHDTYLIYDDETVYKQILSKLKY